MFDLSKRNRRHRNRTAATERFIRARGRPSSLSGHSLRDTVEDEEHREAVYSRCERVVEFTGHLRNDSLLQPSFEEAAKLAHQWRRRRRSRRAITGVAAASIIGVLSLAAHFSGSLGPNTAVYSTLVGEQRTIVLPDQSLVRLNTNSKVSVHYTEDARRIDLERGESFFDVVEDRARPFEVHAADGVAVALGTQFNVFADPETAQATVSVIEGSVRVIPNTPDERRGSKVSTPAPILVGGESVTFDRSGEINPVAHSDVNRINAWQNGKLSFDNLPLSETIAEHNRYTNLKIVLGDQRLRDLTVSGILRIGDTSSLIFLLEESLNLRAIEQQNRIILLPRGQESAHRDPLDRAS